MRFATRTGIVKGQIDPAPMVDVVFLLMIFLVLSSPFVLQPGIGLMELPANNNAPSVSFQTLVVTVNRGNLVFLNNQPVTLAQLPAQLREAAQKQRTQELIIKADKQVTYETVMDITAMALDAGIPAVNLATRPAKSVAAPAPH